MRRNFYEAFTLVEMLIVMGILIILMAIGITAGRFAINRANDVAHQNAVDQIYQGLQAYYTDNREFPTASTPGTLLSTGGALYEYLDQGTFNGGTEATYYYFVEAVQGQSVLVCVTLGGVGDIKQRGLYCNGNGFNDAEMFGGAIKTKTIPYVDGGADYDAIVASGNDAMSSEWNGKGWGVVTP